MVKKIKKSVKTSVKKEVKTEKGKSEALGISGFTLGMISFLELIFFTPYLGIFLTIIGIIFCGVQQKRNPTRLGKIGLVINLFGLVLNSLLMYTLLKVLIPTIQQMVESGVTA